MALNISEQDNVFYLSGKFSSNNAYQIRDFFMAVLFSEDQLTINLSGLDDVDLSAAMLLNEIKTKGNLDQKRVSILFKDNHKIKGPFRQLDNLTLLAAA